MSTPSPPKAKTYLITGANRGLGLEFVRQLYTSPPNESNTIIATVRSLKTTDTSALQSLSSSTPTSSSSSTSTSNNQAPNTNKIHILECDTSSPSSIQTFITTHLPAIDPPISQIDFLLNNAGINANPDMNALTLEADVMQKHIATNVVGPGLLVAGLCRPLSSSPSSTTTTTTNPPPTNTNESSTTAQSNTQPLLRHGSVVMNMTSGIASLSRPATHAAIYAISKAALNMLTVHQAAELKDHGVTVVCVDPGWVRTDMGGDDALLEKDQSIAGVLSVLWRLGQDSELQDTGKFWGHDGQQVAW